MSEILKEWPVDSECKRDELTQQVSYALLKLFFKEQMDASSEVGENVEQEINVHVHWSIKWPDIFWNYVVTGDDGKKRLVDEHINNITWLVFSGVMPNNDRYYICDVWKKCVFFDTQTWKIVEFAEVWKEYRPKIYGKDEVCNDEFFVDLCNNSVPLYPNQPRGSLIVWFEAFLKKAYHSVVWKDIDHEARVEEASQLGRESSPILCYLMWAYEYMYNWKITKYLAWKNDEIWNKLAESEVLKKMYPDLYLTMRELDSLKNVLLDEKWNIIWYIRKVAWKYEYTIEWSQTIILDAFEWPDRNGSSIMWINDKFYFINKDFPFRSFWFDKIEWPDKNGNYLWYSDWKECLIFWTGNVLTNGSDKIDGNKPWYGNFLSMCEGPDKNRNYIVSFGGMDTFLINRKGDILAKYLSIKEPDINGNYVVVDLKHWSNVIDKSWSLLFDERYQKITEKGWSYIKE